ncbi:MAG: type IV secretion system DNA-binding domain-containing protein [Patescibacteria group bacterium]
MTLFDPEKITFFAKTDARGQNIPFGIKAKDRQRHMYVIGKTGMGKSTLLENMAAQDILNGEGVAFIDPHGSAAETLLEYVPEHRVKDVVYFAPFDVNHPISFNVMEDVGADKRHLVVSGLMSTFKKIWVDAWSARMEYILTNALLALLEYPDTTLLSVNRLFIDKEFRKKVVEYTKDPTVKAFWVDEFANYTERFAAEALPAIQNKIGQFTGNPLIRNIIGQPHSSFDIRQMMDEKKILIMNLSKGLIGETNANLLGSMLTTRIYLAAMSRAELSVEHMKQMPNFYFYVDEFQSFANSTFANILSEARKYHLNLIIAHQYIEQMEEDVRNAVFGNVGTTIAFRVGPFDAEVLETVFSPQFIATDLVNLGFAQIYLTLMIDGIGSQPFSAQTLPPLERPPVSYRGMVIEASRTQYASDREGVEKIVAELHNPTLPAERPKPERKVSPAPPSGQRPPDAPRNDKKPFPDRNKKTSEPTKKPEELKAVLAKLAHDTSRQQSNVLREQTKPVPNGEKTSLKDALAGVMEKSEAVPLAQPAPNENAKPVPTIRIEKRPPSPPLPHTKTTEATDRPTIDAATVKRMLRDGSLQERSPFE